MKKFLALAILVALASVPVLAQGNGPYLVDYFANGSGGIRLVNFGAGGTPLTSPVGDVCSNFYVFDANQEMVACCSCRVTPNGELDVTTPLLTLNSLTRVAPQSGSVAIVSTQANGTAPCTPLSYNGGPIDSLTGYGVHLNNVNGSSTTPAAQYLTETRIPAAQLGAEEAASLTQTCQFVQYLGSGQGVCGCPAGGGEIALLTLLGAALAFHGLRRRRSLA